jgi:uncharacterized membrane protein YhaH (DUF805 family)
MEFNFTSYGPVAEVSKTGFIIDVTAIIILLSFILLVMILLLINKIERRYHMRKKDIFLGLLTQIPILGGIVLFKKLVDIEDQIVLLRFFSIQNKKPTGPMPKIPVPPNFSAKDYARAKGEAQRAYMGVKNENKKNKLRKPTGRL